VENEDINRIGELLTELQSPNYNNREEAVRELSEINHDKAIAGLVIALEDADLGIRELAADYLIQNKSKLTCRLLVKFLGSDDIGTRNLASESLVKIGADSIPYLLEQINNDDHDVRKFIVDILGILKNSKTINHLCHKLQDSNLNVVCSAAEALGEIGDAMALDHLVEAYERYDEVRLQVLEALGKIKDKQSLEFLYDVLESDDKMILLVAIEAIGQIEEKDSIDKLISYLDHQEQFVAESSLLSIINICSAHGINLETEIDLNKFKDFIFDGIKNRNRKMVNFVLDHSDSWIYGDQLSQFLSALSHIDESQMSRLSDILRKVDLKAIDTVISNLTGAHPSLKINFLKLISQYLTPEITKKLIFYKNDSDPLVRKEVAFVLGESGDIDVVDTLKEFSKDQIGHVRSAAYKSLGKLNATNEVEHLFNGLNDRYPDVRESAMNALISIGTPKVIQRFNDELYTDNIEHQRLAVMALGMIGSQDVAEPLLQAVSHPDSIIRKSAIESLGNIKDLENIDPILLALNDENSGVRKASASTLVALRGTDILDNIKFMLNDDDVWVKYHVINLIGDMTDNNNVELIRKYLYDEQDLIKIATLKALSKIGTIELLEEIQRLKFESNRDVQEAAIMAVSNLQGSYNE
jgi:HEAT repeat protein